MRRRITIIGGAAMLFGVVPAALGTAAANAHPSPASRPASPALRLHRAESNWHLHQMDNHRVTFARWNRSIHRRCPLAAPFSDRAVGVTHIIHGGMASADTAFLGFHEFFAGG